MLRDSSREPAVNSSAAYSSFLEWNSNPEIASAAQKLYGDIDRLELYVGLQAEEAKPVIEGAGLCPCEPSSAFHIQTTTC